MEKGTWQQEWGCNGGTTRGSGGDFLADVQNPISSATLFLHKQRPTPSSSSPTAAPLLSASNGPTEIKAFVSNGAQFIIISVLWGRESCKSEIEGACIRLRWSLQASKSPKFRYISQIRCREGDRITTAAALVRLDRVTDLGDLCERRFQISGYLAEKIAIRSWHPSHERLNETCKPQLVECLDYGHMGRSSSCMPR